MVVGAARQVAEGTWLEAGVAAADAGLRPDGPWNPPHSLPPPLPPHTTPPRPPAVTVVFSKFDALRLERVVGSPRAAKMLKSKKTGTFLFC